LNAKWRQRIWAAEWITRWVIMASVEVLGFIAISPTCRAESGQRPLKGGHDSCGRVRTANNAWRQKKSRCHVFHVW
jgi:hypothetical protein